jgi:hypothetical protein
VEPNPNPCFGKEGKEKAERTPATEQAKPAPVQENKTAKDSPDRQTNPKKIPAKVLSGKLIV